MKKIVLVSLLFLGSGCAHHSANERNPAQFDPMGEEECVVNPASCRSGSPVVAHEVIEKTGAEAETVFKTLEHEEVKGPFLAPKGIMIYQFIRHNDQILCVREMRRNRHAEESEKTEETYRCRGSFH